MIDLDKYKAQPYEIEQSVLEALPMKESVVLIDCLRDSSLDILSQMSIHRANLDKINAIMTGSFKSK
jgi:hypothetical protein